MGHLAVAGCREVAAVRGPAEAVEDREVEDSPAVEGSPEAVAVADREALPEAAGSLGLAVGGSPNPFAWVTPNRGATTASWS